MGHQGKRNKASSKAGSAVSGKLSSIIGRTSSLYFLRNPGDGRRTRFNIRHQTSRSSSAHLNYTVTHIGISSLEFLPGMCTRANVALECPTQRSNQASGIDRYVELEPFRINIGGIHYFSQLELTVARELPQHQDPDGPSLVCFDHPAVRRI